MTNDDFTNLLIRAIAGSHEAIEETLKLYMPLINRNSYVNGVWDDDCRQYIMMRVVIWISRLGT